MEVSIILSIGSSSSSEWNILLRINESSFSSSEFSEKFRFTDLRKSEKLLVVLNTRIAGSVYSSVKVFKIFAYHFIKHQINNRFEMDYHRKRLFLSLKCMFS